MARRRRPSPEHALRVTPLVYRGSSGRVEIDGETIESPTLCPISFDEPGDTRDLLVEDELGDFGFLTTKDPWRFGVWWNGGELAAA